MKKTGINIFVFLVVAVLLSSCLTVEKKEYTFVLDDKNSGTLTIKFINIMSMKDDTADISESDFNEMITTYIDGNELEADYKNAIVRRKRLFEENGKLCGEVVIYFRDLESVGLYKYDEKSPYMLNIGSFLDSEAFLESNGTYGGDVMPVVFWPSNSSTLNLSTHITAPDETTVSLIDRYNDWK